MNCRFEPCLASPPRFTPKQGQYLAFIHAYTLVLGRPPAHADLLRHFRVTPPSVNQMPLGWRSPLGAPERLKAPQSRNVSAAAGASYLFVSVPDLAAAVLVSGAADRQGTRAPKGAAVEKSRRPRARAIYSFQVQTWPQLSLYWEPLTGKTPGSLFSWTVANLVRYNNGGRQRSRD